MFTADQPSERHHKDGRGEFWSKMRWDMKGEFSVCGGWLDGWMVPCCFFSFLDFKFFCLDFFLLFGWVWASWVKVDMLLPLFLEIQLGANTLDVGGEKSVKEADHSWMTPNCLEPKTLGAMCLLLKKGKPFGSFHPLDGKSHCISANGMTYIYSVYNIYVQKIRYT